MKYIAIIAGLVVLVGGGLYTFQTQNQASDQEALNEAATWQISAPFMCEDGSHFVANFPIDEEVQIFVDGNHSRTLPRISGAAGQRFEDSQLVYVFAGEEVTVTDKAGNMTTTCQQPFDANNAPVNFGDMGEGGGEKQDVTLIVSESITGKWQSIDDVKFIRRFNLDFEVLDLYDGKIVSTGFFKVFTKERPLKVTFPLEENAVYVQLTMAGTQTETLNLKLNKLTPEILEFTYMDRGGVLSFTRVE